MHTFSIKLLYDVWQTAWLHLHAAVSYSGVQPLANFPNLFRGLKMGTMHKSHGTRSSDWAGCSMTQSVLSLYMTEKLPWRMIRWLGKCFRPHATSPLSQTFQKHGIKLTVWSVRIRLSVHSKLQWNYCRGWASLDISTAHFAALLQGHTCHLQPLVSLLDS